jgi:hypothetical protein
METAEEYMNKLVKSDFRLELNEKTVPEIIVHFTKGKVSEILNRLNIDPIDIYWEVSNIV